LQSSILFRVLLGMLSGKRDDIFMVFLRLGLTSFGGPVAHLAYFHREFVIRRQWLSEEAYGELVGLGQFLPGPASSQVGFAIGLTRGAGWAALPPGRVHPAFSAGHAASGRLG
jgi:hypothetical protein